MRVHYYVPQPEPLGSCEVSRILNLLSGKHWQMGCGPPTREPDSYEPGIARHGWQHEASSRVEQFFRARLMTHMADHEHALLRSQSGSMAGLAFSSSPSNSLIRIEPHLFRIILLRRFRLLSPSPCVSVVVAVSSIPLATTDLRARERGC